MIQKLHYLYANLRIWLHITVLFIGVLQLTIIVLLSNRGGARRGNRLILDYFSLYSNINKCRKAIDNPMEAL